MTFARIGAIATVLAALASQPAMADAIGRVKEDIASTLAEMRSGAIKRSTAYAKIYDIVSAGPDVQGKRAVLAFYPKLMVLAVDLEAGRITMDEFQARARVADSERAIAMSEEASANAAEQRSASRANAETKARMRAQSDAEFAETQRRLQQAIIHPHRPDSITCTTSPGVGQTTSTRCTGQ